MAHARPLCRFGLVYTGHTFITAELSKIKPFLLPRLSSAPILACLVAFGCCKLPGFEIDQLQPIPILTRLAAPPDNSEDTSRHTDDDLDNEDDSEDEGSVNDDGTSGESGSTIIPGPKGGDGASFSSNSYLFGRPLRGLKLCLAANSAVNSRPTSDDFMC